MDTEIIICKRCEFPKHKGEFYTNRTGGGEYIKKVCRVCDNKKRNTRKKQTYLSRCAADPLYKQRMNQKVREYRKDPKYIGKFITNDSKRSDKLKGRDNDLDRDWVSAAIANGCFYCGETELRMTLDRIDNTKGHTKDNVNAACIRCNYFRGSVPYAAWLFLLDGLRAAKQAGAFEGWTGRTSGLVVGL